MPSTSIAFVAYASQDPLVKELIEQAVSRANAKSQLVRYEPWIFNDVSGNPVVSPILDRIDDSSFVVADITYLNRNVVYEIGFAIGRRKRAFLIRHSTTEGDRSLATEAGIFDTLGYFEYGDVDSLSNRLTSHVEPTPLAFDTTLDRLAPVYIVEPPVKGAPSTMMTSRVKKARYKYRSFAPTEDPRLSATDAIRQVSVSAGVLASLEPERLRDDVVHNIRSLFVAGLADGMGKPTLLLAAEGYVAPLDVRDDVKLFRFPDDITEYIAAFSLEITDHLQQTDPLVSDAAGKLQQLRIGDPTAENEMTTLASYFLRTDQYSRALLGEVNLVVGRKGSGKTALFIQLRDKIRSDKRNVVVDLKPEGYQLIKLKEELLAHLTPGTRQHLITAFWEYLILLEVAYKLLEKDRKSHKHNHEIYDIYLELEATYKAEIGSGEGDFSERLLNLSLRIAQEYRAKYGGADAQKLNNNEVTQLLYGQDIRELRTRISKYLSTKQAVWVLFDNLDKGWSTHGIDVVDAIVLRCLIDAGRKVERDMRKDEHSVHCIIFVRNDVYEHLMLHSADYGKEMRAVLDWTDADLLREMLRLRLVSGLSDEQSQLTFEQVWPTVCVSHYKGEDTSSYFIDRSLMRPRNVLKIFNHCRGFASNFNRPKITEDDIDKGLKAYSQDLLTELDHELSDVFPDAKDVLYHLLDSPSEVRKEELDVRLAHGGVGPSEVEKIVSFLLYYGVIGVRAKGVDYYIYDVNYDLKVLEIRAAQADADARYVINSAFWPALSVVKSPG